MVYPEQLDLPDEYLSALGSFWSASDRDPLLRNLISSRLLHDRHMLGLLDDYRNSFSRQKCPLLMKQEALLVRLRETDRSTADSMYRFGDTTLFFDGRINYGQINRDRFSWSLPDGMVNIAMIADRLDRSTVSWFGDTDYTVEDGKLLFLENPFEKPGVPINDVLDGNGTVVNREIWVWLYGCRYELNYLYKFYGYAVGLPTPSTENAKQAVNAVYDAITKTNVTDNAVRLLTSIVDTKFAIETGEIVENVFYDNDGLCVITNKQVCRAVASAVAVVEVGDVLRKNQALTDTASYQSLRHGTTPDLPMFAVQPEWLDIAVPAPLVLTNEAVAVRATPNEDTGHLEVEFDLCENDDEFWAEVRSREVVQGISLAKLMLGLTADDDEPAAGHLPATIRPLEWFAKNFLRNAILITIKTNKLGRNALQLSALNRLRYSSAPHIWYIVVTICEVVTPSLTLTQPTVTTLNFVSVPVDSLVFEQPITTIENTGESCR